VKVEFDPAKRDETLAERELDFIDAPRMFEGRTVTMPDTRFDYGEDRWVTFGWIDTLAIVIVYTWRGDTMRMISMRRAHKEELDNVGLD
jgi:uncharacterized protein